MTLCCLLGCLRLVVHGLCELHLCVAHEDAMRGGVVEIRSRTGAARVWAVRVRGGRAEQVGWRRRVHRLLQRAASCLDLGRQAHTRRVRLTHLRRREGQECHDEAERAQVGLEAEGDSWAFVYGERLFTRSRCASLPPIGAAGSKGARVEGRCRVRSSSSACFSASSTWSTH